MVTSRIPVAVCLLLALAGCAPRRTDARREVRQAGWTTIALPSDDSVVGVVHDGQSGAFLQVTMGAKDVVGSWAETAARDPGFEIVRGTANEQWSYAIVKAADARAALRSVQLRSRGAVAASSEEPEGCAFWAITFSSAGSERKNYWSAACTSEQADRIRTLVMDPAERNVIEEQLARAARCSAAGGRVRVGDSLGKLLASLGCPADVRRDGTAGIVMSYADAEYVVDRQHRIVEIRVQNP